MGRVATLIAILILAGCRTDAGDRRESRTPASGTSQSCQRACNSEYDSCMDRFPGIPANQSFARHPDDPASALSPNDICPDQLKSCFARCAP